MSETPPPNPDKTETPAVGGWHQPETRGAWRVPEKAAQPAGWRVPTLPADLEEEPDESGGWHLPSPEDTKFTAEDEIEIVPPEDQVLQAQPTTSDDVAPEDSVAAEATEPEEEAEAPVAPEDLIYLMEHMDEVEDDDVDTVPMSELIALASLSEDATVQGAIQGEDAPIPAAAALADEDLDLEMDKLSPAERLMLQGGQEAAPEADTDTVDPTADPAAYARQQLEQLGLGGDDADADSAPATTDEPAADPATDPAAYARQQLAQLGGVSDEDAVFDTSAERPVDADVDPSADPAAYARQQLQQLGMGAQPSDSQPIGSDYTPVPQATEPLDPRKQDLLRRFHETEEQVTQLRQQMQAGQLSQDDFYARLRDMMILDDDQNWWMLGVDSNQWYRSENNQWVPDTPDVVVEAQQLEQGSRQGQPSSQFGPVQDSLPYLPDTGQMTEVTSTDPSRYIDTEGIQLDENFMPLPKRVPVQDPDMTVPSAGIFDAEEPYPEAGPTVPGAAYTDPTVRSAAADDFGPTVMAQPVQYGTIESAIDPTEPPDYDAYEDTGGELYQQAVEEQRRSVARIAAIIVGIGLIVTFLAGAAFIVGALLWYQGIVNEWDAQIVALANFEPEFQTVRVLDRDGNQFATLSREGDDRRPVSIDEMSPFLVHAVISVENPRFYQDPGWDFFSIMRAFAENLTSGEVRSGGSTITQQVARNLILQSNEVSAERKLNEIVVAGELTRRYSKTEILELYMNDVMFFGNQSYGVEAASQFYFGKNAADLNAAEAAMLVAINNSPANNEPVNNREIAIDLTRDVLRRMGEVGCITLQHSGEEVCIPDNPLEEGRIALDLANIISLEFEARQFSARYPHYTQLVRAQLENLLGSTELYRGGYTVTTTLDSDLQDLTQEQLSDRVDALSVNGVNTGAVMVTDPRNGAILAMVGSPDFDDEEIDGQVNNALTFQQPGSAIKPVVYAGALEGVDFNADGQLGFNEYMTPATVLWDVPSSWGNYTPRNFDRQFRGPVTLRNALQQSLNIPTIKVYEFISNEIFRRVAEAMGLNFVDEAEFNLTTAVGSTDVRLYDMMEAYGSLANGGQRFSLFTIENVVDANDNPIPLPPREEPVRAVSEQTAFLMQNILSDDWARQPQFGLNSNLTINGLPTQDYVAAKTGTTENRSDLWTMGFTTNRVVGVWVGTVNNEPTFNTTGFNAAAPLWNTIMRAALNGNDPRQFAPPGGGTIINRQVCADTGSDPDENCSAIVNEFFAANRPPLPAEQATVTTLRVDSWSGLIANDFCPDQIVEVTYANISDPFAIQWINTTAQGQAYAQRLGLTVPVQQPPTQACTQSTPIPVARIANPSGGQTVQGSVSVTGQVSAPDFNRYQLEYAPADTENFVTISTSTTPQPNAGSQLGVWDTTQVQNGEYTLRLAVFSNTGGFLYRTVPVTINNPQATATPTPPPAVPTAAPVFTPIPFDTLPPDTNSGSSQNIPQPIGPTPTVNPAGD